MKLKEIIISNFMPYKGEQKIIFPQDETENVMLLFGDNMRGKTSFLNAIRWGFYGKAIGRHLKHIPRKQLVNIEAAKENDWSMSITLKFSNFGNEYELRRRIEKKSHVSQPKTDGDFEQVLGLRINGEVKPNYVIDNELNQISPEEISRFFLFDGELLQEYENLLIDESEQGEKIKEHIEQVLGVPALIHGRDELSSLLKEARKVQAKDAKKNTDLKHFAERQNQLAVRLSSIENDLKDLKSQRDVVQKDIDDIDDELKNTEAVQRKKFELEGLVSSRKSTESQIQTLANEQRVLLKKAYLDVLNTNMSPLLAEVKDRRDLMQSISERKAVLNSQINTLQKSIDGPTCATCKQIIPDEKIQPIRDEIANLRAEEELSSVDPEELKRLNKQNDRLSLIQSANEGARLIENSRKENRLKLELWRIENKEDELEAEIREYDTDQIMRQRKKRDQLIAQLSHLNSDIDKTKKDHNKNIDEQDHIATLISKNVGAQGQRSSIRVNMYQDLEAIFSEGIDRLRDALRTDVEYHATKAFAELTTEKTYSGLRINQNYGLSILDQEGRVLNQRSAGAEQVVALSLIDGLNRTARKAGPIVMDTPLGRLDPKHRGNVLKYLPKMAEQVVLLVHEGEIDPDRDLQNFAERTGSRYTIERISATESRIVKGS